MMDFRGEMIVILAQNLRLVENSYQLDINKYRREK